MQTPARPSLNLDLFDASRTRPFVRRAVQRAPGRGRSHQFWGVYQRAKNGVETCLGIFLDHAQAREFSERLWNR